MDEQQKLVQKILIELQNSSFLTNPKFPKALISSDNFVKLLNTDEYSQFCLYLIRFLHKDIIDLSLINQGEKSSRAYAEYLVSENWDGVIAGNKIELPNDMRQYQRISKSFKNLCMKLPSSKKMNSQSTSGSKSEMTIMVHGTWSATSNWWQQNSPFWNYINGITGNVYSGKTPFYWSGRNSHSERDNAARKLITWVANNCPKAALNIIAHSHGGNVCLLASRYELKIKKLILLGTPIRCEYLPDLKNIKKIYNVFSTTDITQLVGTFPNRRFEGRTLGDTLKITNIRAHDNGSGSNPSHTELHDENTWNSSEIHQILR